MGYSGWSGDTARSIASSNSTKATSQVFTSKHLKKDMSPYQLTFREARDSDKNPLTVPIMVFLDVTGSMGRIPENLVKHKFPLLMDTMIKHQVSSPTILFGAIGDHHCDDAPLQIGQFESGATELNTWLTKMYLEGGGGGQKKESYLLSWLFGARYVSTDHFEKRGCKGFLFTVGDEATWDDVSVSDQNKIFGTTGAETVTAEQLLREVERTHYVFHIHVNEGSYANDSQILDSWKNLLNERLIVLDDYTTIAETIAATVAVMSGADLKEVTSSFDAHTSGIVTQALAQIGNLVPSRGGNQKGIVTL